LSTSAALLSSSESSGDRTFMDDPVTYIKEKVDLFVTIAKQDPVEAIKFVPEVAGGIASVVLIILTLLITAIAGGSKAAPSKEQVKASAKKAKDAAQDAKDQAAEAVATGAENAKAELNKRTTRSSKE